LPAWLSPRTVLQTVPFGKSFDQARAISVREDVDPVAGHG
jgi:hypothetical protein